MTLSIGFLGLGAMGARMARRLIEHGDFDLTVWNRSPAATRALIEAGARGAASPREASDGKHIVISMLRDDEACEQVWCGGEDPALAGLAGDTIVVECSTVTPGWIERLGDRVRERGAMLVDAPVVGSRPQAEAGALIFLVGGEQAALGKLQPLLAAMGNAVHHAGPLGSASLVKLMANTLFASQVAVIGELLEVGARAGLAPAQLQPLLAALPMVAPAVAGASALMVQDRFAPLFPIDLVAKDMAYAGRLVGDEEPSLTAMTGTVYARAVALGLGTQNINAVTKLYRAGT